MGKFILSYDVQCGAYLRLEYWLTSSYDRSWPHSDTMNAETRQASGTMKPCTILHTLVVDDFGVKYINNNDGKHLIASLEMPY